MILEVDPIYSLAQYFVVWVKNIFVFMFGGSMSYIGSSIAAVVLLSCVYRVIRKFLK